MVKQIMELIEEIISAVPEEHRCPYLAKDDISPYCANGLKSQAITEERRMVTDIASLQLWCLDKERCNRCIYYQAPLN